MKVEDDDMRRAWRQGFWIVASPVVFILGLFIALRVAGLFIPYLDDPLRARLDDQWTFGDAIAIDRALEKAFLDRWRLDGGPFALRDILGAEATDACVRGEQGAHADYAINPSRDLAARSDRPWWWRGMPGTSTIAVQYADGRVRAFRLVGSSYPYFGLGKRLRFAFESGQTFACGKPVDFIFTPRPRDVNVATFQVGVAAR
jgi:hypothetical protein